MQTTKPNTPDTLIEGKKMTIQEFVDRTNFPYEEVAPLAIDGIIEVGYMEFLSPCNEELR